MKFSYTIFFIKFVHWLLKSYIYCWNDFFLGLQNCGKIMKRMLGQNRKGNISSRCEITLIARAESLDILLFCLENKANRYFRVTKLK